MNRAWRSGMIACWMVGVMGLSLVWGQDEAAESAALHAAKQRVWRAIETGAFADSIHHALMRNPGGAAPYGRLRPDQIIEIAENLLAYQNGDGGWPKNVDWLRILTEREKAGLPHGQPGASGARSTLDNGASWSQIEYLAQVREQTGLPRYERAVARGLDYLLREQRDSGGWCGSDVDAITFNDDVMIGTMRVLREVARGHRPYSFVDPERRRAAESAVARGVTCVLRCQIRSGGRLTAWCQQHDHRSFEPVWARSFEPPSITCAESTEVVRFLMEEEDPRLEEIAAVESAVAWLREAAIPGKRLERRKAVPAQYLYHFTYEDVIMLNDTGGGRLWARFCDLETWEPIYMDRDRKRVGSLAELSRERRTGYGYLGKWPERLIEREYPEWKQRLSRTVQRTKGTSEEKLLGERYPGDRGIAEDPEVLFAEDFEVGDVEAIGRRWGESSNEGGEVLSLVEDVPLGEAGVRGRSLRMCARVGRNTGGHMYTRLKREVDEAYLRFYVKFPEPAGYVHHFVTLGGYHPATGWPQGKAGERPRGDDRVTVGIEPFGRNGGLPAPGAWNFYTYWQEMKVSAGGRYWGNGIAPGVDALVPAGRWQCVEVKLRLNSPGKRDGELALWLDGREVMDVKQGTRRGPWTGMGFEVLSDGEGEAFEGFAFRTDERLKINFVWLMLYVTEGSQARNGARDSGEPVTVLFDQVVVARRRVGPLVTRQREKGE